VSARLNHGPQPLLTQAQATLDFVSLSTLASAVAGQSLVVMPAKEGERTQASGHEIQLDLASMGDITHARQAVLAHALLASIGSHDEPGLIRLMGKGRECQRYLQWELARGLSVLGERLPGTIEQALRTWAALGVPNNAEQSLEWALQRVRAPGSAQPWPQHLGIVKPSRTAWQILRGEQAGPDVATADQPPSFHKPPQNDKPTPQEDLANRVIRLFSSPQGGGAIGSVFLQLLGMGPRAQPGNKGGTSEAEASALSGQHNVLQPPSETAEQLGQADTQAARNGLDASRTSTTQRSRTVMYPEWFEGEGKHKDQWVKVQTSTARTHAAPGSVEAQASARLVNASGPLVRQQIARIGLEFQRHRAQPDGQDFDLDALVAHAVEGGQGSASCRLYRATRRTKRELSLMVVLDTSHSTGDQNEAGIRILDQQVAMAKEIVRASAQLGDQVGAFAFHSWGRHKVNCIDIKRLDERMSAEVERRFDALEPAGMTRIGAAIRHATARLDHEKNHSHRLMVLLSDGFAYDDEYDGMHARFDTAQALREARQAGIGCVCLNIGSPQDDVVLKQLYGSAAYLRCTDTDRAVPALRRLMRHAMAGAASAPRAPSKTKG
jgi:nitric oxide reductase NorD protein